MKSKRFTEEQIISAVKQVEGGLTVVDVGREIGVSKHTLRLKGEVWRYERERCASSEAARG